MSSWDGVFVLDNEGCPNGLFVENTFGSEAVIGVHIVIISAAPLLIVYPFFQKHFIQGVMIGSVKG
jgi:putative aldouronate transport system permease protein